MEDGKSHEGIPGQAREAGAAADGDSALASFAARLLKDGCPQAKSFVSSPACLYATLEALARGAEGETLSELESALGGEAARRAACSLLFGGDADPDPDGPVLDIASSVWANRNSASLRPGFCQKIADVNGQASEVDFRSPEDTARISSWLSDATGGKFPKAPDIDPDTTFAIIGALRFKDAWFDRLDEESLEMPFRAPRSMPTVTMMGGSGSYGDLLRENAATAVSWPMTSGATAVLAMPDEGVGIRAFIESGAAWDAISRCRDQEGTTRPAGGIELLVPELEIRSDGGDLAGALRAMGVRRAFGPGAELGGITEAGSMVGKVLQGAVLKLDPDGAEGAAYTLMVAPAGCLPEIPPEPVRVVFDRPFAFALFSRSGAPLFVGAYTGE